MKAPHRAQQQSSQTVRPPLRLTWGDDGPGRAILDGAWWPHSRDMATELGDLFDHFPAHLGRPRRALVSRPDWDAPTRRIPTAGGYLKAGSFPHDDTHQVVVLTSRDQRVRFLVVPPSFSEYHAAEAMLAACTSGNTHTATELLDEVTDQPDDDPSLVWS